MSIIVLAVVAAGLAVTAAIIIQMIKGGVLGCEFNSTKVVERLNEDYPAFQAERVVFDSAGRGALILPDKSGPVGFVWQLPRKTITRLLSPEQLYSWSVNGPQLKLRLARFGLLAPTLLIDDPDDLIEIRRALETGPDEYYSAATAD